MGKIVKLALVWLVLMVVAAVAWRYVVAPAMEEDLVESTSASARVDRHIGIGIDSFSGYAVLRSRAFQSRLEASKVGMRFQDDGADYEARFKALEKGKIPLAVFTLDAWIQACARHDAMPGVIVMLIDETRGADALVAYKKAVPSIDALNRADARFVVTGDSPSETLVRVAQSHFSLPQLGSNPWQRVDGAEAVLKKLQAADTGLPQAYALWEPYVSAALQDDDVHVLVDSSHFRGYIVDVLIASRTFVKDHPEDVQLVVSSYFAALNELRQSDGGLAALVQSDAEAGGSPLDSSVAASLSERIWWKNTIDNLQHMGVQQSKTQHLTAMAQNIIEVLQNTGALQNDPFAGKLNHLYLPRFVETLAADKTQQLQSSGASIELRGLAAEEWQQLQSIGTVAVPNIVFPRGTAIITERAGHVLDAVKGILDDWPGAYLLVRGQARPEGDPEANKALAQKRADAVAAALRGKGISSERLRAQAAWREAGSSNSATVAFMLGFPPY